MGLRTSRRRLERLSRLLRIAQADLREAERAPFRFESNRKWRVTLLRHKVQRLQEALGLRTSGVRRKRAYRIGEAARLLSVSNKTIYRWESRGRIRCERSPGGHMRIAHTEIERLKKRRRI